MDLAEPGVVADRSPPPAPSWLDDADWRPAAELLERLRAEVASAPRDRRRRNALAWALLRAGRAEALLEQALDWQRYDPRNPMVYEYAGEALSRLESPDAGRAFSSIAEVSPNDSGLLNRAGYLALSRGDAAMAEGLFRVALERRPDHHNNYRGLALALWAQGRHEDAAAALEEALGEDFHPRYGDLERVLREELGRVLRAWKDAAPERADEIAARARRLGIEERPDAAARITLHWETDANDVDLHVVDPHGEECYYSHKRTASGLELYEDLTQGLGPEVAVVRPEHRVEGTYHVGVKYFRAGPMGVSRGVVLVERPSSAGRPRVEVHPFTLLPDLEGRERDMRYLVAVDL